MNNFTETEYLRKFKSFLSETFVPYIFEVGNYKEGAFCIEKAENNQWMVYYGERGQKQDVHTLNDRKSACLFFLEYISSSPQEANKLKRDFLNREIWFTPSRNVNIIQSPTLALAARRKSERLLIYAKRRKSLSDSNRRKNAIIANRKRPFVQINKSPKRGGRIALKK